MSSASLEERAKETREGNGKGTGKGGKGVCQDCQGYAFALSPPALLSSTNFEQMLPVWCLLTLNNMPCPLYLFQEAESGDPKKEKKPVEEMDPEVLLKRKRREKRKKKNKRKKCCETDIIMCSICCASCCCSYFLVCTHHFARGDAVEREREMVVYYQKIVTKPRTTGRRSYPPVMC